MGLFRVFAYNVSTQLIPSLPSRPPQLPSVMSIYTQYCPSPMPEYAITFKLPTPAETMLGAAGASACINVSATILPGQNRAIVDAGNVGFAKFPRGAMILMGR